MRKRKKEEYKNENEMRMRSSKTKYVKREIEEPKTSFLGLPDSFRFIPTVQVGTHLHLGSKFFYASNASYSLTRSLDPTSAKSNIHIYLDIPNIIH